MRSATRLHHGRSNNPMILNWFRITKCRSKRNPRAVSRENKMMTLWVHWSFKRIKRSPLKMSRSRKLGWRRSSRIGRRRRSRGSSRRGNTILPWYCSHQVHRYWRTWSQSNLLIHVTLITTNLTSTCNFPGRNRIRNPFPSLRARSSPSSRMDISDNSTKILSSRRTLVSSSPVNRRRSSSLKSTPNARMIWNAIMKTISINHPILSPQGRVSVAMRGPWTPIITPTPMSKARPISLPPTTISSIYSPKSPPHPSKESEKIVKIPS